MFLQDGVEIPASDNVEVEYFGARWSLTLLCVGPEDCGTYTCEAENSTGQVSCHAQLTVESEGMALGLFI